MTIKNNSEFAAWVTDLTHDMQQKFRDVQEINTLEKKRNATFYAAMIESLNYESYCVFCKIKRSKKLLMERMMAISNNDE
ncbi:MAG: hypothetical protein QX197_12745 [Methylococcaceae bacterium]